MTSPTSWQPGAKPNWGAELMPYIKSPKMYSALRRDRARSASQYAWGPATEISASSWFMNGCFNSLPESVVGRAGG